MLSCKQASQLTSQGLDKKLSMWERVGLKLHLTICKNCQRFSQQMQRLHVTIRSLGKQIEEDENIILPEETKKRIVNSINTSIE